MTKKQTEKDKLKKVSRAHVRYKTSDGMIVPGATTITGLANKPYLVKWANNLGLEGINSTDYTNEAAKSGTLAHALVVAHLEKTEPDTSEYTKTQIDLAENALISFFEWKDRHDMEVIFCEKPFVSDVMKYGGTVDCYCKLDGKYVLLDFKTSSGIYPEHFCQVSAYAALLREAGHQVDECRILRIGREDDENFEEKTVMDDRKYFECFQDLLSFYYHKKEAGWK